MFINVLLLFGGLILPLLSVVLAWVELFRARSAPTKSQWRRAMSVVGLLAISFGLGLEVYVFKINYRLGLLAQGWGAALPVPPYPVWAADLGAYESLAALAISLVGEGKIRKFLILGAVGLLLFFALIVGESW